MNPHDTCAWNKKEKNEQLPIMFHIDYVLIAHLDTMIVTKCVNNLDEKHGANDPLIVAQVKVHEHLGMTVDWSLKLGVDISQCDFVKKLRFDSHEGLKGGCRKLQLHISYSRWIKMLCY